MPSVKPPPRQLYPSKEICRVEDLLFLSAKPRS